MEKEEKKPVLVVAFYRIGHVLNVTQLKFLDFVCTSYSPLRHLPFSDSAVWEDAGLEPRAVATFALAARHRFCFD
jgi:hypothetical protein